MNVAPSLDEIEAVEDFVRDSSWINSALRGVWGCYLSDAQSKAIRSLDSLFHKAEPLSKNIVVYRATTKLLFTGEGWLSMTPSNGMNEGSQWHDPGFVSTTVAKRNLNHPGYTHPTDRVKLKITVPKGQKAIQPDEIIKHGANQKAIDLTGWERETLLPRGLRFKVTKITTNLVHVVALSETHSPL